MANKLKAMEVVFYDYLRSAQSEKYRAQFDGTTSGSIAFADGSVYTYASLAELDAYIAKANTCYSGVIAEYSGDWTRLANQAKAMLEDMLVDGEFNNDGFTDPTGQNYNRKPLGVIQAFIDWCETKAGQEQSKANGGIAMVINVP